MSPTYIPTWTPRGSVLVTPWRGLLAPLDEPSTFGSWILPAAVRIDSGDVPLPVCVVDPQEEDLQAIGELTSWTQDRPERTLRASGIVETWRVLDHLDERGRAPVHPVLHVTAQMSNGVAVVETALLLGVVIGTSTWTRSGITIGPATVADSDLELARAR